MTEIVWLITERGTLVPFINGYKFQLNRSIRGTVSYWKCTNSECPVTVTIESQLVKSVRQEHCHPLSLYDKIGSEARTKIRSIVQDDPFWSAKNIYDKCVLYYAEIYPCGSEERNYIPTFSSCKAFIYNEKHRYYPIASGNAFQLVFNDAFRNTRSGNRFLQIDENVEGRLMIFSDLAFSEQFFSDNGSCQLFMDGTFKT